MVWISACGRVCSGRPDRAEIQHSAWRDSGGGVARQAGTDAAKTVATGLPTRSGSDRGMAARAFPAIARQAKASGGKVYFWDEFGVSCRYRARQDLGKKGETPVVERPGQRQSISAASAVNARGAFWYCTYHGGLTAELFVTLLRRMMRRRSKPVHLVVTDFPRTRPRW